MAQAQTNIDQGKSPAEIFANDCATCHKSARGLANGRGSSGLASFLVEHYTASKDQAAALAAYVMGAGGGEAAPRGPKPGAIPDRNRASAEPPPSRPGEKPEQAPSAAGRPGPQPATASRTRRNEPAPAPPAQQPAAVVAEPAPSSAPAPESPVPGPSAAAPANADTGDTAPVPRDDIPD
jgi:hypothetical protein